MYKWVATTGSILLLGMTGCAAAPGAPDATREVVTVNIVEAPGAVPGSEPGARAQAAENGVAGRPAAPAQAPPPREAYHEKFTSFVKAGVERIEVQPKVYKSGAPVEFRVSGSLPYVNDEIESVETEVDPGSRTVKVSVVVRRPAIRLPMVGHYDVKATFVPPAAGQYVLEADGVRQMVVVNGCERKAAGA